MPGKFEKRSARLVALFLALIMVGSALLLVFRGPAQMSQSAIRNIKYNFKSLNQWLKCVPPSQQIIYVSLKNCSNNTLMTYLQDIMNRNIITKMFDTVTFVTPIQRMLVAYYPNGILYLIDINGTKITATGKKEEINGINVWVKKDKWLNGYIAVVTETSPVILGTYNVVNGSIYSLTGKNTSMADLVGNYTSKIPGKFNAAFMFYGKAAESLSKSNNTSIMDFYFAGIRMNGSMFEKVVAIHFIVPGMFIKANNTSLEYYNFTNYKNGLSIAKMDSTNLTKVLNSEPKMKVIIIHMGNLTKLIKKINAQKTNSSK